MNPLSLLSGVWGYVAAGVIAAGLAVAGTHYVDAAVYGKQLSDVRLVQSQGQVASVTANLAQLQGFITNMHTADAGYGTALDSIKTQFAAVEKELKDATRTPLPADCRPDAGRLRALSAAVAAANARSAP